MRDDTKKGCVLGSQQRDSLWSKYTNSFQSLTETFLGFLFPSFVGEFHVSKTAVDEKAVAVQYCGFPGPAMNSRY